MGGEVVGWGWEEVERGCWGVRGGVGRGGRTRLGWLWLTSTLLQAPILDAGKEGEGGGVAEWKDVNEREW